MKSGRNLFFLAGCLTAWLPSSLAAQARDDQQIVITGEMMQAEKQVDTLTKAITRKPRIDKPFARRYSSICIGVTGLSSDFAHVLIARIEKNARQIGIAVEQPECDVNTLVVFTSDSRAAIEHLHETEPHWFATLLDYEYKRVLRGNGAAQAWHATSVKGADGKEFSSIMIGNPPRPVQVNDAFFASHIKQQLRVDIEGSIVVFDTKFVPGKSIQQLADYATMRLFASTDDVSEGAGGGMETILGLFTAGGDPPSGLTQFDRAYLGALYSLPPTAGGTDMHDAAWSAYKSARYAAPPE